MGFLRKIIEYLSDVTKYKLLLAYLTTMSFEFYKYFALPLLVLSPSDQCSINWSVYHCYLFFWNFQTSFDSTISFKNLKFQKTMGLEFEKFKMSTMEKCGHERRTTNEYFLYIYRVFRNLVSREMLYNNENQSRVT